VTALVACSTSTAGPLEEVTQEGLTAHAQAELERATQEKLSHTTFLEHLLQIEVASTHERRLASRLRPRMLPTTQRRAPNNRSTEIWAALPSRGYSYELQAVGDRLNSLEEIRRSGATWKHHVCSAPFSRHRPLKRAPVTGCSFLLRFSYFFLHSGR
jgi:hypothetical protein